MSARKIAPDSIQAIVAAYHETSVTKLELADAHGVSHATISGILSGEIYRQQAAPLLKQYEDKPLPEKRQRRPRALTPEQVKEIRRLYWQGQALSYIQQYLGVSLSLNSIWDIANRNRYRWVQE